MNEGRVVPPYPDPRLFEEILRMGACPQLDARAEELVFGRRLDWTHDRTWAELLEDRPTWQSLIGATKPPVTIHTANDGRGVYVRCPGCGLRGYWSELDLKSACPTPHCPPYSTDMAAAWKIAEAFDDAEFSRMHACLQLRSTHGGWMAQTFRRYDPWSFEVPAHPSAALTIARAGVLNAYLELFAGRIGRP